MVKPNTDRAVVTVMVFLGFVPPAYARDRAKFQRMVTIGRVMFLAGKTIRHTSDALQRVFGVEQPTQAPRTLQ